MRKFAFGMWNSRFRNASVIRKFEIRNSKFEIPRPVKGKEGFTLIEIVLVLVIIAVLAGILIEPFRLGVKSYIGIETRADLTSQAREATTRMIRELRNIPKEAGPVPEISAATATSISFTDVLDNGVTFSLSGSTVQRNSNVLADQVSSLQFRYFDKDNNELTSFPLIGADRDKVRRILVILTMQEGTETVTMTGQAFLRDLRGL